MKIIADNFKQCMNENFYKTSFIGSFKTDNSVYLVLYSHNLFYCVEFPFDLTETKFHVLNLEEIIQLPKNSCSWSNLPIKLVDFNEDISIMSSEKLLVSFDLLNIFDYNIMPWEFSCTIERSIYTEDTFNEKLKTV